MSWNEILRFYDISSCQSSHVYVHVICFHGDNQLAEYELKLNQIFHFIYFYINVLDPQIFFKSINYQPQRLILMNLPHQDNEEKTKRNYLFKLRILIVKYF